MEKSQRVNTKRLFLTYFCVPLTKEEVLEQLKNILPLKDYIIAKESHENGGYHIHAYLVTSQKINITLSQLDLLDYTNHQTFHGNYQAVRNQKACIRYVKKGKDYITNIEDEEEIFIHMKKLVQEEGEKGIEKALRYYLEKEPAKAVKNFSFIKRNLKEISLEFEGSEKSRYSNFVFPQDILDWAENESHQKSLILVGPSGYGKTEGLIYFCNQLDLAPLRLGLSFFTL